MNIRRSGNLKFVISVENPWYRRLKPFFEYGHLLGLIVAGAGFLIPFLELVGVGLAVLGFFTLVKIEKLSLKEGVELNDEVTIEKNP